MRMRDPRFKRYDDPETRRIDEILHILKRLPNTLDLDAIESDGLNQNEVERLSRGWPYISMLTWATANHFKLSICECIIKNSSGKDIEKLILAIKVSFDTYIILCLPQSSGGPIVYKKDWYGNGSLSFERGPILNNMPLWFQRGVRLFQEAITARGL